MSSALTAGQTAAPRCAPATPAAPAHRAADAAPALAGADPALTGAAPTVAGTDRPRFRAARRLAWGGVALALVGGLIAALSAHGGGWQAAGFGLGPDLALLLGAGAGLVRGQLHPRAVPAYNAVHRIWGPAVLGAAAASGALPAAWLAGALAWGLHVAVDRTCGYGLRTRDGFQRA
jgi:hypothetical protein